MVRPIAANIGVSFAYGRTYSNGVIHKGVDFSDGHEGHAVMSCLDGTVTHAGYGGWGPAYGNHVIIKSTFNGKTKWVLYGHMLDVSVKVGRKVSAGDHIGLSGGKAGKKYSGNSTGPHLHVQVGHANNYLAYEDPWSVINSGATPAPTPTPAKPSIPALGAPWFTIGTYNTKAPSLTKTGTHKWSKRRAKVVANIVAAHLDVFCGQEMGSGADLAWYDDQLRDRANLKRVPGGSDWRHIWHTPTTSSVVESGHFELAPLFQKDTKEAAWAVLNILGNLALVASMHLEEANGTLADAIRVEQAANLVEQAKKVADKHDIPVTRWFLCGDTNSTGLVKAEMAKHGLIPASINAHASANTLFASLNNWIKKAKGGSVDYIFIGKTRPVSLWRMVVDWIASDHNLTYARITLTGKK